MPMLRIGSMERAVAMFDVRLVPAGRAAGKMCRRGSYAPDTRLES
jgi:hypothetical protein